MIQNHLHRLLVIGILLFQFTASSAQQASSLKTTWELVQKKYPGIQAKDAHIKAQQIDSAFLMSKYLPKLQTQYQHTYGTFNGINGAFFPQAGFFNTNGNADAFTGDDQTFNSFGSVTANWELVSFGRKKTEQKISSTHVQKAFKDYETYLLTLKKDLAKRYLNAVYQQAYKEWTEKNIQRIGDVLEISKSLSISGVKPMADTLIAASSYTQALAERDKRSGAFEASQQYLSEYTGEKNQSRYNTHAFVIIGESIIENTSANSHPAVQAAVLEKQKLEQQATLSAKEQLPSVNLLAGLSSRSAGIYPNGHASNNFIDGFDNRVNNYLVGAGITWSLSDIHRNKIKAKSYKAQTLSAQKEIEEKTLRINAGQQALQQQLFYSRDQLKKSRQSVTQASEAFEMYVTRYESGLMNLSELLQIQLLLEDAEKKHLENSFAFWMQTADYAGLTGDFTTLFNHF